ncbi:MAG TPA: glycosyltransferase family 39 protein, partial [Roseiflexaceae bacterium]|nr:glycosyltransferase family 39 protein [Roseiflexaceae bacterium]
MPATIAHHVADPAAERFFHRLDRLERNDERSFRWSLGRWSLGLYGLEHSAPVVLRLTMSATRPPEHAAATLQLDGRTAGAFQVAREWRTYRLLVQPDRSPEGVRSISFEGSTFIPAGERGDRALGVAVEQIQATALTGGAQLGSRAFFLALLALLGGLSLQLAGLRVPIAIGIAIGIGVLLGGLSIAAPVMIGYWLPELWLVTAGWGMLLLALAWRRHAPDTPHNRYPYTAALIGLTGTLLLWGETPIWLGLLLLFAGALLLAGGTAAQPVAVDPTNRRELLLLGLITVAGAVLRFGMLNDLPAALWRDEARHGLFALQIWQTDWYRPVYEPAVDLPALILYLIAPLVGIFGPDLWTLRGGIALVGTLAPPALWLALRPLIGARPALLGAALMALSLWAISMSRWAMAPILDVTISLAAIGCLAHALQPGGTWRRALMLGLISGLLAGLALYTYHTGRIAPLIVLLIACGMQLRIAWPSRAQYSGLAAFGVGLLIAAAPLITYAADNSELFSRRVDRVGVLRTTTRTP